MSLCKQCIKYGHFVQDNLLSLSVMITVEEYTSVCTDSSDINLTTKYSSTSNKSSSLTNMLTHTTTELLFDGRNVTSKNSES